MKMDLLRIRGALAFTAILSGALMLNACSGDDEPTDSGVKTDTGGGGDNDGGVDPTMDATTGGMDARPPTPDTGPRDTGPVDSGVVVDPCTVGEEGCPCTSSLTPQTDPVVFVQDNCMTGMVCIPFDLGLEAAQLTGPIQTCAKPCMVDADCGGTRVCRETGFLETTGAGRICFDEAAEVDEFCHLSKLTTSRFNDAMGMAVPIQRAGTMVACPEGVTCLVGVFSDVHPDEGICLNFCERQEECADPTPYCNPRMFSGTSSTGQPVDIGVCSTAQLAQGAVCGTSDPEKVGLASSCDTSVTADVGCARVTGLFPPGLGFCIQGCGSANPCEGTEAAPLGPYDCLIVDAADPQGGGVCTSDCSKYPDNCSGDGLGFGRMCAADLITIGGQPFPFCMDRVGPALAPATLDTAGEITAPGDNCGQGATLGFASCPEPGYCEFIGQDMGICVFGCSRTSMTTGCEMVTGTSTCAEVFMMGGQPVTDIGLCGGP